MSARAGLAAAVPRMRSCERAIAIAGAAALGLASVGLFLVSRGKWSDAIVDSGREWIVPDALSRGDLLYRDVVYWFGPLTPYFHAALFKIFGSSFSTLVLAGIVGSIGVLAALYFALRTVIGRREALLWTALAVPALIFMPRAGGAILGMGYRMWHAAALSLFAIALLCGRRSPLKPALGVSTGVLCALAGLCRTEWGLSTAFAAMLVVAIREGVGRRFWRVSLTILATFAVVFSAVLAVFVWLAGTGAVLREGHVLLAGLPKETVTFLHRFSWSRDWQDGILQVLYSSCLLLAGLFVLEAWASRRDDPQRLVRRLPWIVAVNLYMAIYPARGGASARVLLSAAPAVCAAAVIVGVRLAPGRRAAALAGFGLLGLLLSFRRPLGIGDSPYVAPPLLFAFVSAALLMEEVVDREQVHAVRHRLRRGHLAAVLLLVVFAFVARVRQYSSDQSIPVEGTQAMLSAAPEDARRITDLVLAISYSGVQGGLVVFPEGEVLNYLTGRPNPLRHKLYIPGYLSRDNESAVLRELEVAKPSAIVVLRRFTGEYGVAYFGFHYGRPIRDWVEENYAPRRYDAEWNGVCKMQSPACLFVRRR